MSTEHTTHHDDCGCLTARYEAQLAALRAENAAQAATIAAIRELVDHMKGSPAENVRAWAEIDLDPLLAGQEPTQ